MCRKFAMEAVELQKQSMKNWGLLADYENSYYTMSPEFEANQLRVLAQMLRKNLIYTDMRPVFYSPASKTALAEGELEYIEDYSSLAAFVRFELTPESSAKLGIGQSSLVAWTTTPWTLPANKALAVNENVVYSLLKTHGGTLLIMARARIPFVCAELQHSLDVVKSEFCKGSDLVGLEYSSLDWNFGRDRHILRPVFSGDFVADDSGSGVVHLAPDHGNEDYELCRRNGVKPGPELIDADGNFNTEAPFFLHGCKVLRGGSEMVVDYLKNSGTDAVLSASYYKHRYPCDWRTKTPIMQRATRQWFVSIESIKPELKKAIEETKFVPEHGKSRLWSMVTGRSSWCISRQRSWGVPIPAFENGDGTRLLTAESTDQFASMVANDFTGTDIWWSKSIDELKPSIWKEMALSKTFDTMDVWFDSGTAWCNHEGISDMYLEGFDQFRGWFQSSLITSVACTSKAPFKSIMAHGFVLDSEGRKMSKSVGNIVDPMQIVKAEGTDSLRLWAASTDFTHDVLIGEAAIKGAVDIKRIIRNAMRFCIANLYGLQMRPSLDAGLSFVDRLALNRLYSVQNQIIQFYESNELAKVVQMLTSYCNSDLSSFYFDILKDRLYTEPTRSPRRQGSQVILLRIVDSIAKMIQPIMPILAQEVYEHYRSYLQHPESHIGLSQIKHELVDVEMNQIYQKLQRLRIEYFEHYNTKLKPLGARSTFQVDVELCQDLVREFPVEIEWRDLLMAAQVQISSEPMPHWYRCCLSSKYKCPRCWSFASIQEEILCPICEVQLQDPEMARVS